MEFECWSLKVMFSEDNKAKNTSNELSFSHYFENNFSILGHGKHQKCPGKGHGKSWNFIRSKEYEPCIDQQYLFIMQWLESSTTWQPLLASPKFP